MFFKQYYLGCLSHASYMVGDTSTGRAVVIDPQRDIEQYRVDAVANDLQIERVPKRISTLTSCQVTLNSLTQPDR